MSWMAATSTNEGEMPPCMHKIQPDTNAAGGMQSKQFTKIFHNPWEYFLRPEYHYIYISHRIRRLCWGRGSRGCPLAGKRCQGALSWRPAASTGTPLPVSHDQRSPQGTGTSELGWGSRWSPKSWAGRWTGHGYLRRWRWAHPRVAVRTGPEIYQWIPSVRTGFPTQAGLLCPDGPVWACRWFDPHCGCVYLEMASSADVPPFAILINTFR